MSNARLLLISALTFGCSAKEANLSKAELRHILVISPVTTDEYGVRFAD